MQFSHAAIISNILCGIVRAVGASSLKHTFTHPQPLMQMDWGKLWIVCVRMLVMDTQRQSKMHIGLFTQLLFALINL